MGQIFTNLVWDQLNDENGGETVYRAAVPNGWLVSKGAFGTQDAQVTFVPDPQYVWLTSHDTSGAYNPANVSTIAGGIITTSSSSGNTTPTGGTGGGTGGGSSSSGGTSTGTSGTTSSGVSVSWIYKNGLQGFWLDNDASSFPYYVFNQGQGGSYSAAVTDDRGGSNTTALQLTKFGNYAGFFFSDWQDANHYNLNEIVATNYYGVTFDIENTSTSAINLRAGLAVNGNVQNPVYYKDITISGNSQWNTFQILLSGDASVQNTGNVIPSVTTFDSFYAIDLTGPATQTVNVNNVGLLVNPNPPTFTSSIPPVDPSPATTHSGWLHTSSNQIYLGPPGTSNTTPFMGYGVVIYDNAMGGQNTWPAGNQFGYPAGTAVAPDPNGVAEVKARMNWLCSQGVNYFCLNLWLYNASSDINSTASAGSGYNRINDIKSIVQYAGTLTPPQGGYCYVVINPKIDYLLNPNTVSPAYGEWS